MSELSALAGSEGYRACDDEDRQFPEAAEQADFVAAWTQKRRICNEKNPAVRV